MNRRRSYSDQVFTHYGDVCACCGSKDRLSVDHVDGRGLEHRQEIGEVFTGWRFHKWLIDAGFPEGYQTMCQPCNSSKKRAGFCQMHNGVHDPVTGDHAYVRARHSNGCVTCWNEKRRARRRTLGRACRGEEQGTAKLTDQNVLEIRRLYAEGWTQHKIGAKFGVSQSNVSAIVLRKKWTHI